MDLIVNGKTFVRADIGQWLNRENPEFKMDIRTFATNTDRFIASLRLIPNAPLTFVDRMTGIVTTPLFKKRGISGWLPLELPFTCVAGAPIRDPAISTDGFATIDLSLDHVQMSGIQFGVGPKAGSAARFIRVEYLHKGSPLPRRGQAVTFCGEVKWDSDFEGWYEIHPRGSFDVTIADRISTSSLHVSSRKFGVSWG